MKWIIKTLGIYTLVLGAANAQTTSQTLCFSNQNNKQIELVLQKYVDNNLQKEVGAFVKYSASKTTIPLVYVDDSTTDDTVDYELRWLEIFNEKITGEYRLLKPKKTTIAGAYVIYKSIRTGKEVVFTPSGKSESDCLAMLNKQ